MTKTRDNNKVLVTGGAGYIGSHTVISLLGAGYTPIIVDNLSNSGESVIKSIEKITSTKIIFYKADVCDRVAMKKIWAKEKPDYVVHFAAKKAVGESVEKPLTYYQNNLNSLTTILSLMLQYDCYSIIFSSSCTIYGDPDTVPVYENTLKKSATNPYGASKQMCERILEDVANEGIRTIALRYFNPIGAHSSGFIGELPNGKPNNLVPFLTQATAGHREPLTVFGDDYDTPDGTCIRDYVHVVDVAEAHVAAIRKIKSMEKDFTAINIGTGRGYSVLEVIKTFENVNKVTVPYGIGKRREGDAVEVWADCSLAKDILGWHAEKTLSESLKDAWNWQKELDKEKKT